VKTASAAAAEERHVHDPRHARGDHGIDRGDVQAYPFRVLAGGDEDHRGDAVHRGAHGAPIAVVGYPRGLGVGEAGVSDDQPLASAPRREARGYPPTDLARSAGHAEQLVAHVLPGDGSSRL
jgi:hypothetical protein